MYKEDCAYVTMLSSEDFVDGVKVLYASLKQYSEKRLVVMVNEEISNDSIEQLTKMGMEVVKKEDIRLEGGNQAAQEDRWIKSLFKLRMFGLTQYKKLVYLDGDLLICDNIDELFECEDFSAVRDIDFIPDYGRPGMNAGVMCLTPSAELENELVGLIPAVAEQNSIFGDQDVVNMYLGDWDSQREKHLDVSYNACFYRLDEYTSDVTPKVVHFIFGDKPWMWSKLTIFKKKLKWTLKGQKKHLKYLKEFFRVYNAVDAGEFCGGKE